MATLGMWFIGVGVANAHPRRRSPCASTNRLDPGARARARPLSACRCGVWLALVCLAIACVIQNYTRLGRYIYALGGGEDLAALSGIPAARVRIMAFTLAGVFYARRRPARGGPARPRQRPIGQGRLFTTITAVVVGGTALSGGQGGVLQTLVGVLIVVVLANGMVLMGISPYVQTGGAGPDDHRRGGAVDRPQAD